jgi:hypothetical protein
MSRILLLDEPKLEFGLRKPMTDPHVGLTLFGPYDLDLPSQPRSISYALIGTKQGIDRFISFVEILKKPVISCDFGEDGYERKDVRLWPPFPGFEAAFHCVFPNQPSWTAELDSTKISLIARDLDSHKRAYELVNLYLDSIRKAAERDEGFQIIICIVPDIIWQYCRPKSKIRNGVGRKISAKERRLRKLYYGDLFGTYDPEQYDMSIDFRRQLKARSMEYGIPIQIIRESTLSLDEDDDNDREVTCLSDRAWNLSTTIYYKSGGKPWRLATARDGVCYIGFAFRRTDDGDYSKTACCAAQMFLDTGDGVVFRGEFGPWYSPETKEYHLDTKHAEELLRGVIKTYYEQEGKELKEIFLHSRSSIYDEEFAGYRKACPSGVKIVGIRVAKARDELRIYRPGKWCVQRGTAWIINDRTAYLWASGFKVDLLTYDGWEVPIPLRIDIQHGSASIEQMVKDILGLTKLNYNACRIGDSEPVTVGFSNKVGEILVSNPTIRVRRPSFRFYI